MAANYPTKMYRGTLGTGSATLYTVPAGRTGTVTEIVLANKTAASAKATITIEGVELAFATTIPANGLVTIDIKQVIPAGGIIAGFADTAAAINAHVSGVENY